VKDSHFEEKKENIKKKGNSNGINQNTKNDY
jgi:hypothetical protein